MWSITTKSLAINWDSQHGIRMNKSCSLTWFCSLRKWLLCCIMVFQLVLYIIILKNVFNKVIQGRLLDKIRSHKMGQLLCWAGNELKSCRYKLVINRSGAQHGLKFHKTQCWDHYCLSFLLKADESMNRINYVLNMDLTQLSELTDVLSEQVIFSYWKHDASSCEFMGYLRYWSFAELFLSNHQGDSRQTVPIFYPSQGLEWFVNELIEQFMTACLNRLMVNSIIYFWSIH